MRVKHNHSWIRQKIQKWGMVRAKKKHQKLKTTQHLSHPWSSSANPPLRRPGILPEMPWRKWQRCGSSMWNDVKLPIWSISWFLDSPTKHVNKNNQCDVDSRPSSWKFYQGGETDTFIGHILLIIMLCIQAIAAWLFCKLGTGESIRNSGLGIPWYPHLTTSLFSRHGPGGLHRHR